MPATTHEPERTPQTICHDPYNPCRDDEGAVIEAVTFAREPIQHIAEAEVVRRDLLGRSSTLFLLFHDAQRIANLRFLNIDIRSASLHLHRVGPRAG